MGAGTVEHFPVLEVERPHLQGLRPRRCHGGSGGAGREGWRRRLRGVSGVAGGAIRLSVCAGRRFNR